MSIFFAARLGSERKKVPKDVFLEHMHKPSIKGADLLDAGAAEPVAGRLLGETGLASSVPGLLG